MIVAQWMWLLPVLPLIGFVVNGWLSLNSARLGPADPSMPNPADHNTHGAAALRRCPAGGVATEVGAAAGRLPAGVHGYAGIRRDQADQLRLAAGAAAGDAGPLRGGRTRLLRSRLELPARWRLP